MEYVRVKDLQPLHVVGISKPRPYLRRLSDKRLLASVHDPESGDFLRIDVDTGKIVDGNGRAYELRRRAALEDGIIAWDTLIPFEPHKKRPIELLGFLKGSVKHE
jgi:hypothetical protein